LPADLATLTTPHRPILCVIAFAPSLRLFSTSVIPNQDENASNPDSGIDANQNQAAGTASSPKFPQPATNAGQARSYKTGGTQRDACPTLATSCRHGAQVSFAIKALAKLLAECGRVKSVPRLLCVEPSLSNLVSQTPRRSRALPHQPSQFPPQPQKPVNILKHRPANFHP
jgi:hypothetical protein